MGIQIKTWLAGALAALSLTACATQISAPVQIRQIVSTTSFGMCAGYCNTRLEISETQAVLVRNGHGRGAPNLPEQRLAAPLQPGEWQEIARLAAAANLNALPDTIGCPDCADGGAESLSIAGASGSASKTVTFEYNARIDQAQALLERVRAVRARMTPQN